ncbi:MAG: peptidylprolyl isomerase [Thermomicrobiales bacterium]
MDMDNGVRLSRRRVLAFGAASAVVLALAACGSSTATETPKAGNAPGGLAGTVQAAASAVPAGAASTAQAIASAIPGGAAAAASQVPASAAANTADVASRNGKYKSPPPMTIDKAKKYTATIATNKGTMKADLFVDTAPITVNNFVFLANDHFYDGVIFHRIVAGFVIQGGDPTGTGTGGPGYKFPDEPIPANRNYEKGTLAMANSGPNTNGSQFFICVDNLTAKGALPKQYNIFGKVTEGLDVIDKILAVPRTAGSDGAQSKPTEKVFMESVTIQTQ